MSRSSHLLLSALVGLAGCGPPRDLETPEHLVLVSIDTLRADHLSCYGYERETSPNLDALSAAGVRFESCFSPTSWTLPSHLSMLTGLAISAHGIDDDRLWDVYRAPGGGSRVPMAGRFLPEQLLDAGFLTAGYYSWKYLEPRFGFGPGFQRYERIGSSVYAKPKLLAELEALLAAGKREELAAWQAREPELFDPHLPNDDQVIDRGLAFLREVRDTGERMFLFLHLFDPHEDYVPPEPFASRFADPDYAGPIDGRGVSSVGSQVTRRMSQPDLEHLIALYDGEIAWTDSQIGRLVEGLEELDQLDDTLLMVVSDHGEEFFEHGQKSHRHQLYAESTHVPWIVHFPGSDGGGLPRGLVVRGLTGLVDVVPTALGLLDLPVPDGLTGADLSQVVRGRAENRERAYTQLLLRFEQGYTPVRTIGLRTDERALLWQVREPEVESLAYFDGLEHGLDAGEGRSLDWGEPPVSAMADVLDRERTRLRKSRAIQPWRWIETARAGLSQQAELEALGYVQGERSEDGAAVEAPEPMDARLPLDGGIWPDE